MQISQGRFGRLNYQRNENNLFIGACSLFVMKNHIVVSYKFGYLRMFISKEVVQGSYTWEDYLSLCKNLVAENKSTGAVQTVEHAHYSSLNLSRMKRVFKTFQVNKETALQFSETPRQFWLLITESWCGDAAQSAPVFARLAALSPTIQLRIIIRDEHLDIVDLFLTNGGRAIPKLIGLNPDTFEVNWHWGPRPQGASDLVTRCKNEGLEKEQISLALQEWYNQDKGIGVSNELTDLLSFK